MKRIRSVDSGGFITGVIIKKMGIVSTEVGHTMVKNNLRYALTGVSYCVTPYEPLYTEQTWKLIDVGCWEGS